MVDRRETIQRQKPAQVGELISRTALTLGMSHHTLAGHLGVSRRSVSRWTLEGTWLDAESVAILARLAHRRDPALAAQIAALSGDSLVSLGLEAPAPPAVPSVSSKLVDAIVCAASEAADVSPRAMRPGLVAAIRCAREAGVTLEEIEGALSAGRGKRGE